MPRYAFRLRLRPDAIEQYELEHARVWPEMLAELKEVGISEYSIFRRDQDLFCRSAWTISTAPGTRWTGIR